jgi:hypothetical protein
MNQQLLDKKNAELTRSGQVAPAATQTRSRQEQQRQRRDGRAAGAASDTARRAERSAPERPSATESCRRSEQLAHDLAGAGDLGELVAIIQEHGRPAAARAAAVRPDLVPLINGEFPHIALSLADLD